jgi:hypothetical protein
MHLVQQRLTACVCLIIAATVAEHPYEMHKNSPYAASNVYTIKVKTAHVKRAHI